MAEPIVEQIAVNIEAAINAITVANGFNQDLRAVRPRRNDFLEVGPGDLDILVVQDDPGESEDAANGSAEWIQPFILAAFVIDSDLETAAIDTRLNRVRSDIEMKLREDPKRGGLAFDTRIRAPAKFDEGPNLTGIAVAVDVAYRTEEDDPYTSM